MRNAKHVCDMEIARSKLCHFSLISPCVSNCFEILWTALGRHFETWKLEREIRKRWFRLVLLIPLLLYACELFACFLSYQRSASCFISIVAAFTIPVDSPTWWPWLAARFMSEDGKQSQRIPSCLATIDLFFPKLSAAWVVVTWSEVTGLASPRQTAYHQHLSPSRHSLRLRRTASRLLRSLRPTSASVFAGPEPPPLPKPESFIIGDRVWVSGTKPGNIVFLGETKFADGDWAGERTSEKAALIAVFFSLSLSVFWNNWQ